MESTTTSEAAVPRAARVRHATAAFGSAGHRPGGSQEGVRRGSGTTDRGVSSSLLYNTDRLMPLVTYVPRSFELTTRIVPVYDESDVLKSSSAEGVESTLAVIGTGGPGATVHYSSHACPSGCSDQPA
eukprot:1193743-Prorocentrum_minimum.AAC.5